MIFTKEKIKYCHKSDLLQSEKVEEKRNSNKEIHKDKCYNTTSFFNYCHNQHAIYAPKSNIHCKPKYI